MSVDFSDLPGLLSTGARGLGDVAQRTYQGLLSNPRVDAWRMGVGERVTGLLAFLAARGIPGIRYLDQGSRSAGAGTSNYVVFPGMEKQVKILSRE